MRYRMEIARVAADDNIRLQHLPRTPVWNNPVTRLFASFILPDVGESLQTASLWMGCTCQQKERNVPQESWRCHGPLRHGSTRRHVTQSGSSAMQLLPVNASHAWLDLPLRNTHICKCSRPQNTQRQFHRRNADFYYCFSCGEGNPYYQEMQTRRTNNCQM